MLFRLVAAHRTVDVDGTARSIGDCHFLGEYDVTNYLFLCSQQLTILLTPFNNMMKNLRIILIKYVPVKRGKPKWVDEVGDRFDQLLLCFLT